MNDTLKSRKESIPFSVTILGILALTLLVFNAIRFGVALAEWGLILALMPQPGPLYIALTGLIWAMVWLILGLGIMLAWRWSEFAFLLFGFLYASYYWLDRFIFQPHIERNNVLFALLATFVFFIFILILLALPKSRAYFNDKV